MEPVTNMVSFGLDRAIFGLLGAAVLSIVVERALAVVFEWRWIALWIAGKGLKEPISIAASYAVASLWHIDLVGYLTGAPKWQPAGIILTALLISGGAKGWQHLFEDVMGVKSSAARAQKAGA